MRKLVKSIVVWLKGEPVVGSVLAADALTAAAHFGIHLDTANTMVVGAVLSAVAAAIARANVAPNPPAAPPAA